MIEKGNVELYLKYGLLIFILILGMINVFFYFYRRRKGIDSFRKKEHEIWMDILKIVPEEEKKKVYGIIIGFALGVESRGKEVV